MPHKCKKCLRELRPWSKFKDLKSKEGLGLAICGSMINGVDHFWSGESRSNKQKADFRTLDLHYCEHCKSYYIVCPECGTLNPLSEMLNETRTLISCSRCRKRILYAEGDYSMGGG